MDKGEIAHYEQFLFFPQCFQKVVSQKHQKVSLCGNGLILKNFFSRDVQLLTDCLKEDDLFTRWQSFSLVKPRLHRAIADKSVVFLSKVGMEPTETDLQQMSHIDHLFSTYQNLLGKDEFNR